ncbi:uncharacterized protein Tco025E_10031, partial [Trypanosoma conorhini]
LIMKPCRHTVRTGVQWLWAPLKIATSSVFSRPGHCGVPCEFVCGCACQLAMQLTCTGVSGAVSQTVSFFFFFPLLLLLLLLRAGRHGKASFRRLPCPLLLMLGALAGLPVVADSAVGYGALRGLQ